MNKLRLTCECGQEMVVPESAVGRSGLCPGCGAEIAVRRDNTRPHHPVRRESNLLVRRQAAKPNRELREKSWRDFAAAVDLYNSNRFAEAFAVLDGLLERFPANPHVQTAREQCITALQESAIATRLYDGKPIKEGNLNPQLVKSVILDKMRNSGDETVQLQAADMAARILGLYPNGGHNGKPQEELPDIVLAPKTKTKASPRKKPSARKRPPRLANKPKANDEIP